MRAQALMGPPMGFAAKMANYAAVCARLGQPPSPPPEPQLPVPLSHTKGILSSPEQIQRLMALLEPPTTLLVQRAEPDGPQPPVTKKTEMLQVCQISETILVYLTGQHRQHPTLRASHGKSELTSKLNEGGPLLPESLKRGRQPCLTKDGESQPPRRLHRGALGPAGPPSISCLTSSSPSTQTPSTALPSLAAADVSELEQAELSTCGAIRFRRAGSPRPRHGEAPGPLHRRARRKRRRQKLAGLAHYKNTSAKESSQPKADAVLKTHHQNFRRPARLARHPGAAMFQSRLSAAHVGR